MNNFEKFNKIRKSASRKNDTITNVAEVSSDSGFRCLHIMWLYPDIMNIHGGRGDIMALLHMSNQLGIPVEIRRCDRLQQDADWKWPHIVYMTAGELKCVADVITALKRQIGELEDYVKNGGFFLANGSSGAVMATEIEMFDGKITKGLGLLNMRWKARESVWGDDIWIETEDGFEIVGNQIQVADVILEDSQEAFGKVIYGRGNNADGTEGAKSGNVIYTGVLGPILTKNPEFTAAVLASAAKAANIKASTDVAKDKIEVEIKSAEYIKNFIKNKMPSKLKNAENFE